MNAEPDLPGLAAVVAVVDDVAQAFHRAGHRLYLVGGVVRDLVMNVGSAADDIDLTTDAPPEVIKRLVQGHASALWTQGERFGTIGATVNDRHIEITTHRAEVYASDSRNPAVAFGSSIDDDLIRRDFTINAMAISLPEQQLLDPFGGLADLRSGILRTPLAPDVSFEDDPLRMLRAARFLPRFGLEPEPGLLTAASELAGRLAIVSVERVHDELERLLAIDEPAQGFEFLRTTGLLAVAVPGLASRPNDQDDACVLASSPGSPLVRRAGLLVPLGPDAAAALAHLRYAKHTVKKTMLLLGAREAALDPAPTGEVVRRVIARVGLELVDELLVLAHNTAALDAWKDESAEMFDLLPRPFQTMLAQLNETEDLADLEPPLSGGEVMQLLDLGPGPEIGEVLGELREQRLREGPMTREEALVKLKIWQAARSRAGARADPG